MKESNDGYGTEALIKYIGEINLNSIDDTVILKFNEFYSKAMDELAKLKSESNNMVFNRRLDLANCVKFIEQKRSDLNTINNKLLDLISIIDE